jgi:exodeoxyribonuclease VII large subunit
LPTSGIRICRHTRVRLHTSTNMGPSLRSHRPKSEFVRVAVIRPETSAGLGDFRREADLLSSAKLCEFHLFPATFQGVETSSSIQTAVLQALTAHKQKPFDVLVLIRGGGSVTDLAWLNDMDLAKLLCQSPVPIFTGIGHERDNTILDEIAHTRFDTPSKVVLHITTTIKDNAFAAIEAWERINALVGRIISREKTMLAIQSDRIEAGARSVIKRVQSEQEGFIKLIRSVMTAQVREATIALETQQGRLINGAETTIGDADLALIRLVESISQKAQLQLESERSEIERLAHTVALKTQGRLDAATLNLDQIKTQVGRDSGHMVTKAIEDLDRCVSLVESGTISVMDEARKAIENFARIIVGMGPQSTLQRGFAIVRDDEDKPLTSREATMNHASFQVQFRDGRVAVANKDRSEGDEQ